jgi:hypothetical protein
MRSWLTGGPETELFQAQSGFLGSCFEVLPSEAFCIVLAVQSRRLRPCLLNIGPA